MAKAEDENIDIPGDEDENIGDESPKKRREKRKKSKEERTAERRVIFWTLLIVMIITFGFWLMPNIGNLMQGNFFKSSSNENTKVVPELKKPGNKNFVEITL